MSSPTAVLVTGGNRGKLEVSIVLLNSLPLLIRMIGIGRAIVLSYLQRPNVTLIAGVRDPAHESAKSLNSLPLGTGSKLLVVKIDSSSEFDAKNAVAELQSLHGITKLDIVIANAGIGYYWTTALDTSIKQMQEHYLVNSIAPLLLFQATSALMAASGSPKFIVMSSVLGSMGAMEQAPLPGTAYGSSKAALNYTTRKIHFENPYLTTFVVHPG